MLVNKGPYTVNSDIFAKRFVKIKSSRNGEITLSTTDMGKSYPSSEIFRS